MVYRDTYVEWVWDKHDRDMNVGAGRGVGVGDRKYFNIKLLQLLFQCEARGYCQR